MDEFVGIWNRTVDFLTHVSWGSVITYMGIGAGIFFGVDRWILSHRKPKARLRFANGEKEITLTPHYYNKTSTKYYKDPCINTCQFDKYHQLGRKYKEKHEDDNAFRLSFQLYNNGKLQLENYKVKIEYDKGLGTVHSSQVYFLRKVGATVEEFPPDGLTLDSYKKPQVLYKPLEKDPLNQKDSKQFTFVFVPNAEIDQVVLRWHIIAKDFSGNGKLTIHLKPYYTEYDEIIPVYMDSQIPEGAERVDDLTPYIQQFEELLKQ